VIHYLNALERLDVLVPRPDGGWGAVEVKLDGEELIEQGAASLPAAVSSIDLQRAGEPAFMAVATATGRYAYRRDDGVCGPATSGIPRTDSQLAGRWPTARPCRPGSSCRRRPPAVEGGCLGRARAGMLVARDRHAPRQPTGRVTA
jgi:hypothetical protein